MNYFRFSSALQIGDIASKYTTICMLVYRTSKAVCHRSRCVISFSTMPDTSQNIDSGRRVDLINYLEDIEDLARSIPPDSPLLRVRMQARHRKIMLGTLFGFRGRAEKIAYEKAIRGRRHALIYSRLQHFATKELSPIIAASESDLPPEVVTQFRKSLEQALSRDMGDANPLPAFSRVASGPIYRGSLRAMVEDIAPQLIPSFEYASDPLFGRCNPVVAQSFIDGIASIDLKAAAARCLTMYLQKEKIKNHSPFKECSENCEKSLFNFLKSQRTQQDDIVLENVLVRRIIGKANGRDNARYVKRISNELDSNSTSGFIMTRMDRHELCSEFDGIVLRKKANAPMSSKYRNDDNTFVAEIWESKLSIHPKGLMDAILKKFAAAKALIEEDGSFLIHKSGTSVIEANADYTVDMIDFGIYTKEIVPPSIALIQLKMTCCHEELGNNLDAVLRAIDDGFVQVKASAIIDKIATMKEPLLACNGFRIHFVRENS